MTTKLAFATDDGELIHSHFGRAQYYEIVELGEDGAVSRSRIPKFSPHVTPAPEALSHDDRHAGMFQALAGVDVLIARGMGIGAISGATAMGIKVILCDTKSIDEAVLQYQKGELAHNDRRVHHNHHPEHHNRNGGHQHHHAEHHNHG